jgi:branched-chain amino acid transport system substrate-binding protein
MRRPFAILAIVLALAGTAQSQETARIGIIAPFSGPFAVYGQHFQRGAELYLEQIGGKAGATRIELLYRDESGGPERAKQLAQELIVRDKIHMLAGILTTPSALAIAPLVTQSKMPTVIFNAGTSMITRRSPYFARVSQTSWQGSYTIAEWAARSGLKEVFIAVSDYAAGHDSRDAFKEAFTKGGGKVVGELLIPTQTTDFAPYLQRIKDARPAAVYVFMPVGPPSIGFVKTFAALGLPQAGIKLLGTGDTDEPDLPTIGEAALGVITSWHYSLHLDTPENKRFVAAFRKKYGDGAIPNFASVAAYDGMHAIADVIARLGTGVDGDRALAILKGWKAESPRGPIVIDPVERDIVQNQYIRRVERVGDGLGNIAFETFRAVKDPWKVLNP